MAGRVYHKASDNTAKTTTSSIGQVHTSLTFTPNDNKTYAIFWTARCHNESASGRVGIGLYLPTESTLTDSSGSAFGDVGMDDPLDRMRFGGFRIEEYGASPGSQTFEVRYKRPDTGVVTCEEVQIIALELDDADEFSKTDTYTGSTSSTTYVDAETLTFTPGSAGDYLVLFNGSLGNLGSSIRSHFMKARHDSASVDFAEMEREPDESTDDHLFFDFRKLTNLSGSQTFKIQVKVDNSSVTVEYGKTTILALRLDKFVENFYAESNGVSSTLSTAFQNKVSLTATPRANEDLLVLSSAYIVETSANVFALTRTTEAGSTIPNDFTRHEPQDAFDWYPAPIVFFNDGVSAETTWEIDFAAEGTSANAEIKEAHIAVLNIEGQEGVLEATLYDDPDSFGAHFVETNLAANLYEDPDSFGNSSLLAPQDLTHTLYDDADSFGASSVAWVLQSTLYNDPDSFGFPEVVAGPPTLTETLYEDIETFGASTIVTGEPVVDEPVVALMRDTPLAVSEEIDDEPIAAAGTIADSLAVVALMDDDPVEVFAEEDDTEETEGDLI